MRPGSGAHIDESMVGASGLGGEMDEEDTLLAKSTYDRKDYTLGSVYPLQALRHFDTQGRLLDTCEEQAEKQNRQDLLPKIETARRNVEALNKLLKDKAPRDAIQEALYNLAEEVTAIYNTLVI